MQVELRLRLLDRDLGKQRTAHASEHARVSNAADELDNLKSALGAAENAHRQQTASCTALRCA